MRVRRSDPTERWRAVWASASASELTSALGDPSPDVARAAIVRLVEVEGPRAAVPLRERLLSSDPGLVPDLARALERIGDPTVVDVAIAGLRSERYSKRLAAARTLEALADERAAEALRAALRDPIAGVRAAMLGALAELGANEHTAVECSVLLSDPDAQVRLAAIRTVARTARRPGRFLAAAAHDPDPRVRLELGHYSASLPADAARSLLSDPDLRVREAAARGAAGPDQVATLALMVLLPRLNSPSTTRLKRSSATRRRACSRWRRSAPPSRPSVSASTSWRLLSVLACVRPAIGGAQGEGAARGSSPPQTSPWRRSPVRSRPRTDAPRPR